MPLYEAIIPSRYARPLLELVRAQSPRAVDALLEAAGLCRGDIDADAPLPVSRFDALLGAASRHLGRTDLGFELGRAITLESHSTLGRVLQGCATADEMLTIIVRYFRLITPSFVASYRRGRRTCEYAIRVSAPMSQSALHAFLELQAVSIHTAFQQLFGAIPGLEIHVSCPPPPHLARYRELRPTRVHFAPAARPQVRALIPTSVTTRQLPRLSEPRVPASALTNPNPRRAREHGSWAELMLREAEGVQPTLVDLAELINISPRSLTRKLSEEGINLRELAMRVRHERACEMLAGTEQTVTQIGYRLGYSDETAFIRAFRAAQGLTPGAWRAAANPRSSAR